MRGVKIAEGIHKVEGQNPQGHQAFCSTEDADQVLHRLDALQDEFLLLMLHGRGIFQKELILFRAGDGSTIQNETQEDRVLMLPKRSR